jgi:hypothetical protein
MLLITLHYALYHHIVSFRQEGINDRNDCRPGPQLELFRWYQALEVSSVAVSRSWSRCGRCDQPTLPFQHSKG